ncbi:hypothetical protein EV44_g4978 [Erysiphe necator]|uniref:Uncharacterized protein n=1 Tax=Uncinula necator TaxID=52586 RepID=A0A0B1P0E4_UNCNE|nr:hypothetical protein EV44_g4978 [Erysiphe necator]
MKQGQQQTFAAYLNDFEYMLAQAKDYLISVKFPKDNYTSYVNEVKSVAGKLEAKENYVPKYGAKYTETWFITRAGTISHNQESNNRISQKTSQKAFQDPVLTELDADGDTPMSEINGVNLSTLTAIINAIKSQNQCESNKGKTKPPAPWRSPDEFAELRAAGKCTRCARKGHYFKICPSFTWAKRPTNVNAILNTNPSISQDHIRNSDNEDFSGKELTGSFIVRAKGWDKFQQQKLKVKLESLKIKSGTARQVTGTEFQDIADVSNTSANVGLKLFGASIADIKKALEVKRKQSPEKLKQVCLIKYAKMLNSFEKTMYTSCRPIDLA